jgi:hypothetical protein
VNKRHGRIRYWMNSLEILTKAMDGKIEIQAPACSYVMERFDLAS